MSHHTPLATLAFTALVAATIGAPAQEYLAKYPDIVAQWRRPDGIGIQWDQSKRFGPAQQAPLTREYQALFEASLADQALGGQGADTNGQCLPMGMPRMMSIIYPMEIVILPKLTYLITDYTELRRIYTDGRDWPKELEPTHNGYSIGKWVDEDSTGRYGALEVETRGFKSPRTYEASGIQLHNDGQSVIKERISLDKATDSLLDQITVIDNALTRPWTITKRYVRVQNPMWHFNSCSENNHHVWIGKDNYFVSGDGYLMPVKKGQAPPDLRYFEKK